MKTTWAFLLIFVLSLAGLAACGPQAAPAQPVPAQSTPTPEQQLELVAFYSPL